MNPIFELYYKLRNLRIEYQKNPSEDLKNLIRETEDKLKRSVTSKLKVFARLGLTARGVSEETFKSWSRKEQLKYFKEHPDSKYQTSDEIWKTRNIKNEKDYQDFRTYLKLAEKHAGKRSIDDLEKEVLENSEYLRTKSLLEEKYRSLQFAIQNRDSEMIKELKDEIESLEQNLRG